MTFFRQTSKLLPLKSYVYILILLFIGSIIMISLGVIGFYISKIYEEVKQRPRYIVSKRVNAQGPGGVR